MTSRDPGKPLPFSHYDRRQYPTLSVEEGYALWSRAYLGEDRFDLDLLGSSAVLGPTLEGASVLDLACGTGRIGRWLRARGAGAVTGVDRSGEMLRHAEALGVYARLAPGDITATGLPSGSMDGCVCSMALCHVPDLGAFFAECARVLVPGGFLAVVDYHPYFLLQGIPTHFPHPDTGAQVAIENVVHALSAVHREARARGFVVEELLERFVDEEWVSAQPGYAKHLGYPVTYAVTATLGR
ncbi:MAG: methyltransferase domain-containing protein [Deltaproteobacteria bacterium]|nr:methyltransferase domain-containing protein [Deltaproteobacteria bacterium]